jgi:hypothetical protein
VRFVLAVLLLLAGCRDTKVAGSGCQKDSDCGSPASAFRCELQTGQCYCRSDEGCPPRQFCNTSGFCQDRSGCEKNADCLDPSLFCDTTTGSCLTYGRCTSDLQCELGQVCDGARSTCVPGCRSSGDCPGSSCRCGSGACACPGTTPAEVQRCQVGVCDSEFCADNSFCRFGELCAVPPDAGNLEDGGAPQARCFSDADPDRRPYCARCLSGGGISTCGSGANFCIIDTRNNSDYCGADCSEGQSCPRGYGCRDIRVVFTRWQCGGGQTCPGDNALPCASDTDCKRGGSCLKACARASAACAKVPRSATAAVRWTATARKRAAARASAPSRGKSASRRMTAAPSAAWTSTAWADVSSARTARRKTG